MNSTSSLIIVILAIGVAVLAFVAYDRRTPLEKARGTARESSQEISPADQPRSPAGPSSGSNPEPVRNSPP